MKKLREVQSLLKAPKNQRNNYGGYNYRSCEDILEAAKPLLDERGLMLYISDELINLGTRYYVKATATITDGETTISTTAYAREAERKKGMDESQITGSTSSYARKYALNGLFCIDDTRDADTRDNTSEDAPKTVAGSEKPWFNEPDLLKVKESLPSYLEIGLDRTLARVRDKFKLSKKMQEEITKLF